MSKMNVKLCDIELNTINGFLSKHSEKPCQILMLKEKDTQKSKYYRLYAAYKLSDTEEILELLWEGVVWEIYLYLQGIKTVLEWHRNMKRNDKWDRLNILKTPKGDIIK